MLVSVIIPTLNEEASLAATLRPLAERSDVELIVVDGNSADRTAQIARRFTPYVFVAPPGRAQQLNAGARHATGGALLFLDADTILLPGALEELQRRIICDGAIGGAFDVRFDSPRPLHKWVARIANRRMRLLRSPHGNQGVFLWRQVFEALGGLPEIPIMEDRVFARRLRRAGRLTFLRHGLVTSRRRWQANGVIKTALVKSLVLLLFLVGVSPRKLQRIYDRWLTSGRPRLGQSQFIPRHAQRLVNRAEPPRLSGG
jgi:rSAM/selenodomain-associated transferase 2